MAISRWSNLSPPNSVKSKHSADGSEEVGQHPYSSLTFKKAVDSPRDLGSAGKQAAMHPLYRIQRAVSDGALSQMNGIEQPGASKHDRPRSRSLPRIQPAQQTGVQWLIKDRLNVTGKVDLSKDELEITATFIHPSHLRAIGFAARLGGFAVSFRPAGKEALRRIGQGAPMKGHDILEKTIKSSSVMDAEGHADMARLRTMQDANISGYVGHWQGHRLAGLYIDPKTSAFTFSDDPEKRALASKVRHTRDGALYYPVDEDDLNASLAGLKAVNGWESLPFTGDYDMHDIIGFHGPRSPVPSDSGAERRVIDYINAGIAAADPLRPFHAQNKAAVQHGPQHNYFAHMLDRERERPVVKVVAEQSLPLAMCDRGRWFVINTEGELEDFYKKAGVRLKDTWRSGSGVDFQTTQEGKVRLRRFS